MKSLLVTVALVVYQASSLRVLDTPSNQTAGKVLSKPSNATNTTTSQSHTNQTASNHSLGNFTFLGNSTTPMNITKNDTKVGS